MTSERNSGRCPVSFCWICSPAITEAENTNVAESKKNANDVG
jgi:hypothetical protein